MIWSGMEWWDWSVVCRYSYHCSGGIGHGGGCRFFLAHELAHNELHAEEDRESLESGFEKRLDSSALFLWKLGKSLTLMPSFWACAPAAAGAVGGGILRFDGSSSKIEDDRR